MSEDPAMITKMHSRQLPTSTEGDTGAGLFLHRCLPGLCALLMSFLSVAAWAQSADIAGQDKDREASDESSQHVEESEEAYRRRMETAESRDQADVIRPRSSSTAKVPEGIDALPADSRKHLRDQLRNVIIEQGEWKPEDAGTVYPYVPSAAAEKDPELRKEEEQAWGELVQEYHKREAAALAMGGGRGGSEESSEQRQQPSAGSSGSAGAKAASDPAERSATQAASSTAAGAGVSQSALDFLKGQQGGQQGGQKASQQSGQPVAQQAQANAAAGEPASSTGQQESPPEQKAQNAVAQAAADKAAEKDQKEAEEKEPPPPPGSVAIAELVALEEEAQRKAAEQDSSSQSTQSAAETAANSAPSEKQESTPAITLQSSSDEPPPPPGTIAIPELEKLQGMDKAPPLAARKPDSDN